MQISEFSRVAGLSPDTVRFYVRRGLLSPETGMRGGSNPYQIFSREHVEAARLIRLAQSLGFTLGEIATINDELGAEGLTRRRKIALLSERLAELDDKAAKIGRMAAYLRTKIAWLEGGERGPPPPLDSGEEAFACATEAPGTRPRRPAIGRATKRGKSKGGPTIAAARQVRHI